MNLIVMNNEYMEIVNMEDTIPFISIAIASYNYARYLRRAIEMIKKSDFRDFEIVYCDDCSTDNSVEVINEIIKENDDLKIRLIKNQTNIGILQTKTRLIYECTGKYIMICDADDYMAERCLDKLVAVAKKTNADRIVSEVYDIVIDKNGREKILQKQDIPQHTSKWLWNLNHGCLYKREIFIKNSIELNFTPDDVCLTVYFSRFSKSVAWIRKPLYYWCVHEDSAGRTIRINGDSRKITEDFLHAINHISSVSRDVRIRDKQVLELLIIKLYYLQILHGLKKYGIKDKLSLYLELNRIMKSKYPEYLANKYIKSSAKMPLRKYAKRIILLCAFLEKIHLMKIGLIGYHNLGKVIYFDQ